MCTILSSPVVYISTVSSSYVIAKTISEDIVIFPSDTCHKKYFKKYISGIKLATEV